MGIGGANWAVQKHSNILIKHYYSSHIVLTFTILLMSAASQQAYPSVTSSQIFVVTILHQPKLKMKQTTRIKEFFKSTKFINQIKQVPLKVSAYHLPESSIPGGFQKLKLRSISVLAFEPVIINKQTKNALILILQITNFNVKESKLF